MPASVSGGVRPAEASVKNSIRFGYGKKPKPARCFPRRHLSVALHALRSGAVISGRQWPVTHCVTVDVCL